MCDSGRRVTVTVIEVVVMVEVVVEVEVVIIGVQWDTGSKVVYR
jgi:hypothetical protein